MANAPESNNSSGNRENAFILRIKEIVEEGPVKGTANFRVSIFRIPKSLSAIKPVAYEPQLMGLGLFHHCRPELVGMESYKLAAIFRAFHHSVEFNQLVKKLSNLQIEDRVRLSYNNYLYDIKDETLVWIMAIDGMFLLEFLSNHVTRTAHLVDYSGNKLAHHSILREIMMLENQIPMFVLQAILLIRCSSDDDDEQLNQKWATGLIRFCKKVAPLKLPKNPDFQKIPVFDYHHLLDLLYKLAVPSSNVSNNQEPRNDESALDCSTNESITGSGQRPRPSNVSKNVQVFLRLLKAIVDLNIGWVRKVRKPMRAMAGVPCEVLVEMAPKNLSSIPGLETLWDEEDHMASVDEILIPSVSELIDAGVEFKPADDISSIRFDKKTRTFYLPVLKLDLNSEVIIRNMVAYEAAMVLDDSLVFARFIELINGIIDTAQDAIWLREKGIVLNSLKSDQDVADLFNGLSKPIRLSHYNSIDKAIKEVNEYYNNTRKVRVYNFMRKHIYESWRFLSVVAALLLFFLTAIQSVCSVYNCSRAVKFHLET
ncbi:putative UPF0481 protein At3g02645 [Diospyros lotus]|uniref:putative UPF0481 protein At3g02645 n=1 Tax=Diospyros lotus TaxID=55363 RepID=UPI00224EC7F4|nr:putative UPF0481 protein At3g02645 [Diospyros lotus]